MENLVYEVGKKKTSESLGGMLKAHKDKTGEGSEKRDIGYYKGIAGRVMTNLIPKLNSNQKITPWRDRIQRGYKNISELPGLGRLAPGQQFKKKKSR